MKSEFADVKGRVWRLSLTVGMLSQLRKLGADLSPLLSGDERKYTEALSQLVWGNPELFVQMLYVMAGEQKATYGITDDNAEEFASLFDGPTLSAAIDAFLVALVDFRHRPTVADSVKNQQLPKALEAIDRAAIKQAERMVNLKLSELAGSSPDSSASTPGH